MADTVPRHGEASRPGRMRRWMGPGIVILVVLGALWVIGLLRVTVYETYGFRSEEVALPEWRTLILQVEGGYAELDSAGRHVERWGSPYRTNVWVRCDRPDTPCGRSEVREIGLTLTPRRGGEAVVPPLSPVWLMPDSMTAHTIGQTPLAHEEHVAVVIVRTEVDSAAARTDTVRLALVPTFTTRTRSLRDWISRL
ncbi:hypothetical protein [Longimicrobium sp.]|uniref:hypothetical protein n=1 Tax=Longimicrobium sp. TaxID=2029185 RepID=UPI002E3325E7|nr:hypothetical protein [Longimicrobium sp.]HEX6037252.1 hypothetical protein [Longimicrobium sp.]